MAELLGKVLRQVESVEPPSDDQGVTSRCRTGQGALFLGLGEWTSRRRRRDFNQYKSNEFESSANKHLRPANASSHEKHLTARE